jgi:hypothetical protein
LSFLAERDLPAPIAAATDRGQFSYTTVVVNPGQLRKPTIDDGTDDPPPRWVDGGKRGVR